jgi:hypothetical protein
VDVAAGVGDEEEYLRTNRFNFPETFQAQDDSAGFTPQDQRGFIFLLRFHLLL